MYRLPKKENQISISNRATEVQKKLAYVLISMVLVFIVIQFIILSVVGIKGDELSRIKAGQEEQRIQNEIYRAGVMDAQVANKIRSDVERSLGMHEVKIKLVDPRAAEVTAQN